MIPSMRQQPEVPRDRARRLRREQTDAERKRWSRLRSRKLGGIKFRRQVPIGPFIADFAVLNRKLMVELDGGRHAEQGARDAARTAFLNARGFRVVRFWDHEVLLDLDDVISRIMSSL
jgi:very-short-patch-repair endonuclease